MAIVSYSLEEIKKMQSLTDWERVLNMKDEDIDCSDIPELTDEMLTHATRPGLMEQPKRVSVYLSPSLLARYQNTGKGWRTRLSNNIETFLQQQNVAM